MAIQLGSAYGKISIDSSGVKSGVDSANKSFSSLESSAQKLGATMQNVGKVMTASITIPLALMAKQAVLMASSYSESLNKINVVFEENAKFIEEWSKDSASSLGMSQQAALEAAGTYGNLFTAQGMGTKSAADMSMALVQLAADLASFNNANPEEVLLALRSGLSGEIEPLKKFGIAMNEATMKAKSMELGLGDNIQKLSEAEKIQVRYAIIMDQTAKAQGDFARTSEGLANQLRTLKGNWGDTLKILGQNLVPIIEKLLQQLNKWLEWFNNADPKTQKFIMNMLLIVFVAGPLLILFGKLLPMAFSGATNSMSPFSFSIFGLIGTFVKLVSAAAIVVKVLEFFGVATGSVGAGILGLNGAIAGVGASIASIALPILLIVGTLVFLYWAFKNNFGGITTTTQQGWFLVKYYFSQGWAALRTGAAQGLEYLRAGWAAGIADMQVQIDKWVNWLQNAWNNILKYLGDVRNRIVETFRNVDWGAVGMSIINSIANGIFGGIPNLVNAALSAAEQAWNAAQNVFSGTSASSVAASSSASANDVSRSLAASGTVNSRNQSNVTMQFANGVTLRQVQDMLNMNNEAVMKHLNYMLGGA